jgi:hypothetical protein
MCLTVYVVSDVPLPTIPCDKDKPGIHVEDATEGYFCPDNPLRAHSSRPFFYSVRPHDGCGCGFMTSEQSWDDEAGKWVELTTPAQLATKRALADYLGDALRHQASVEVFTFCSGDENCPPQHRRLARPADFLTDRSRFPDPITPSTLPPPASRVFGLGGSEFSPRRHVEERSSQ